MFLSKTHWIQQERTDLLAWGRNVAVRDGGAVAVSLRT